eukprot:Polyplicarium_translucidae@DN1372_c0_g1_i1.p4
MRQQQLLLCREGCCAPGGLNIGFNELRAPAEAWVALAFPCTTLGVTAALEDEQCIDPRAKAMSQFLWGENALGHRPMRVGQGRHLGALQVRAPGPPLSRRRRMVSVLLAGLVMGAVVADG